MREPARSKRRRTARGAMLERADLDFGAQGVVTKLSDGANTRMDEVSAELVSHSCGRPLDAARPARSRRSATAAATRTRSST